MGDVLDAGTGPDSLKWLAGCGAKSITAVTASQDMRDTAMNEAGPFLDKERDVVLVANWLDEKLLPQRLFDTIIADYLLGSVEYFSPHFQQGLLRRLYSLLRPGGWLAISGKEPEDLTAGNDVARLVLDVEALRDAAMVLSRQPTYREVPQWWVREEALLQGFWVRQNRTFPRRLTLEKVQRTLAWAEEELAKVPHESLKSNLVDHWEDLCERVERCPAFRYGYPFGKDYVVLMQRPSPTISDMTV